MCGLWWQEGLWSENTSYVVHLAGRGAGAGWSSECVLSRSASIAGLQPYSHLLGVGTPLTQTGPDESTLHTHLNFDPGKPLSSKSLNARVTSTEFLEAGNLVRRPAFSDAYGRDALDALVPITTIGTPCHVSMLSHRSFAAQPFQVGPKQKAVYTRPSNARGD